MSDGLRCRPRDTLHGGAGSKPSYKKEAHLNQAFVRNLSGIARANFLPCAAQPFAERLGYLWISTTEGRPGRRRSRWSVWLCQLPRPKLAKCVLWISVRSSLQLHRESSGCSVARTRAPEPQFDHQIAHLRGISMSERPIRLGQR